MRTERGLQAMAPRFAIKPRRYYDQNEAIADKVRAYLEAGHTIDMGLDPNSKMSLLCWAHGEIERLRKICGEKPVDKRAKIVVGPRPKAESKPITTEES